MVAQAAPTLSRGHPATPVYRLALTFPGFAGWVVDNWGGCGQPRFEQGLELAWATTWQHRPGARAAGGRVPGLRPRLEVARGRRVRGGAAARLVRRRARPARGRGGVRPAQRRHTPTSTQRRGWVRRTWRRSGRGRPSKTAGARETATHLIWAQETPRSTRGHPTQEWRVGPVAWTPGSHPGDTGSIPVRVTRKPVLVAPSRT
jgi:hypothetical protein